MVTSAEYFQQRKRFLDSPERIVELEHTFTQIMLNEVLLPICEDIYLDFYDRPKQLIPFWRNYPPEQRGRQPKGHSVPWLELGEKTTSSNLVAQLANVFDDITFAGLPTGGDIRFTTGPFFVHLDIKLTGPNDNANEVVVPPNQISGDGSKWEDGVINSAFPINYQAGSRKGRLNYNFQPKLPPLYVIDEAPFLCLTFFLETVYGYQGFGDHPLEYLELSCVPNGLLLFETTRYADTQGLLIAGKDDKSTTDSDKRIRVRLGPLAKIAPWRSVKLVRREGQWLAEPRQS